MLPAVIKFWSKFQIQILWYSFTRDNRFVLTPSQSLLKNRKILPPAPVDTSTTALVRTFSSILNSVMLEWKYKSRELLKAIFLSPKNNKKADRFCMKCSSNFNTSVQRCLYILFENQHFHCLLPYLFRRISQPSGQDLQDANRTYSQLPPSHTEFTSGIHTLISLWTPRGFMSPEYFSTFFSNLYIPRWLKKMFQIHGVKITGKYICEP